MVRAERAKLRVSVIYSPSAREFDEVALEMQAGASVRDAVRASGLMERYCEIDFTRHRVGVWGKTRLLDAALNDGDRVEICRPLAMDPKDARRNRQREQRKA